MDCTDFREQLRRGGTEAVSPAGRAHADSCRRCASELRAAALLRLGSSVDTRAEPSLGFEARLRARLASEPLPAVSGFTLALERAARPALALAGGVFLVCLVLQGWLVLRGGEAELEALAADDPVFVSLLSGELEP